ncbi:voltage-gated hydrogen channel 1 [Plakobranchus ocellatus]|uniref:Voltage-gated hydrogen channel 1 n=1 Tax=Plakobranchus ocellatus TaxID=259542 RepID=A0AAV3ZWJ1_9GAST|nr:voltage-gated hydrogen channel 1 [Plakobranchus ocellatus]
MRVTPALTTRSEDDQGPPQRQGSIASQTVLGGLVSPLRKRGEKFLGSKYIVILVILLTITDCALVIAELILDLYSVKKTLLATESQTYRFIDAVRIKYRKDIPQDESVSAIYDRITEATILWNGSAELGCCYESGCCMDVHLSSSSMNRTNPRGSELVSDSFGKVMAGSRVFRRKAGNFSKGDKPAKHVFKETLVVQKLNMSHGQESDVDYPFYHKHRRRSRRDYSPPGFIKLDNKPSFPGKSDDLYVMLIANGQIGIDKSSLEQYLASTTQGFQSCVSRILRDNLQSSIVKTKFQPRDTVLKSSSDQPNPESSPKSSFVQLSAEHPKKSSSKQTYAEFSRKSFSNRPSVEHTKKSASNQPGVESLPLQSFSSQSHAAPNINVDSNDYMYIFDNTSIFQKYLISFFSMQLYDFIRTYIPSHINLSPTQTPETSSFENPIPVPSAMYRSTYRQYSYHSLPLRPDPDKQELFKLLQRQNANPKDSITIKKRDMSENAPHHSYKNARTINSDDQFHLKRKLSISDQDASTHSAQTSDERSANIQKNSPSAPNTRRRRHATSAAGPDEQSSDAGDSSAHQRFDSMRRELHHSREMEIAHKLHYASVFVVSVLLIMVSPTVFPFRRR